MPLRRLTREEYDFTVRDLLGDDSAPARAFDEDGLGASGFEDPGVVSLKDAKSFSEAAGKLATAAAPRLKTIASCGALQGEACASRIIETFGLRAFRRPLGRDEIDSFVQVYKTGSTELGYGFDESMRMVVEAMLQAPSFLYHWELGGAPSVSKVAVPLDGYALASRLSYFLLRSMPDDKLFAAAADGSFSKAGGLEAEVRRLLADPRVKASIESFYVQSLGLRNLPFVERDAKNYPGFTAQSPAAMLAEAKAFVDDVVIDGDGRLSTLFGANYSFVSAPTAKLYDVAVTSTTPQKTMLPGEKRRGILTQVGFLTQYPAGAPTHPPVLRGKIIYNRVLCGAVSPPGMVPALEPPPAGLPLRQHFEQHAKNPACAGCHALLDPIGFALESFDSAGRYREKDSTGAPLDTKGTLVFPKSGPKEIDGAMALAGAIASSEDALSCAADQWFRFAVARDERKEDEASRARIYAAFQKSGGNLRELLVAIATSKAFTHRLPAPGEQQP